jgi:microcystin-dependent protein
MSVPFLAEMRIMSFNFAPKGWALCNGQLLPINQNQALFSLLGTMYGGDGRVNFALPDLRGRIPMHVGGGLTQGERAGEEAHTLNLNEMPQHTHNVTAQAKAADSNTPVGNYFARGSTQLAYAPSANTTMNPASISNTGGSQPHNNMSPYLVLNFCIALQGIFPSRS